MNREFITLIRADLLAFARKAMREMEGTKLSDDRYLEVIVTALVKVFEGRCPRLILNLPPRHAKSFLASGCFPAWLLGHRPNAKILIVTYADALAEAIARQVRSIMVAKFYQECFSTRLLKGHASATNFGTTAGGEVRATTLHGSVTGFGADIIIVDDPHNATDAGHLSKLQSTIEKFQTNVMTRLNNRKKGAVIVIAHRIHEEDLSAKLLAEGQWDHVALPLIAIRNQIFQTAYGPWHRRKNTLLQPEADDLRDVERLRKNLINPSFELLYQQDVDGQALPALKEQHFQTYRNAEVAHGRVVLSVDPAADVGDRRSYSVIQVWQHDGQDHYLLDQYRERCDFYDLWRKTKSFAKRYRPTAILIEQTANGPALKVSLTRKQFRLVEGITPRGSKSARLRPHIETILAGRIRLPKHYEFAETFVREFVQFPNGRHTDQVDALTQYLGWNEQNPFDADLTRNVEPTSYMAVGLNSQYRSNTSQVLGKPSDRGLMVGGNSSAYPNGPFAAVKSWVQR